MGSLVITPADPGYPEALVRLAPEGTPPTLYLRGALPRVRGVAVVGTREPTEEAVAFTRSLVRDLAAEGLAIWSGGARGIDAVVHEAALACGAPTVVVMGGGLGRPYPKEHVPLFERVVLGGGALLARVPDAAPPLPAGFLLRNELLAALCAVTVVIQAGLQSGARSTAAAARRLGRPLCVVPQAPWDESGQGCALELALGARAIITAFEVVAAMNGAPPPRPLPAPRRSRSSAPQLALSLEKASKTKLAPRGLPDLSGRPILAGPDAVPPPLRLAGPEQVVFAALDAAARHLDEICERSGEPPRVVMAALSMLTLQTVVVEGPAGFFRQGNLA